MADLPQGYRDIPEAERAKAQKFFDQGKKVADTGNYEYAIEMYLQGLSIDPENTDAHQALRDISTVRAFVAGPNLFPLLDAPWLPIFLAATFLVHPWLGWLATGGALVMIALFLMGVLRGTPR